MRRRCRPFTIADAMILVAAVAIGLATARGTMDYPFWHRLGPTKHAAPITGFLLVMTLAIVPIRLRRPRPSFRRLMRQPGMAACAAVLLVMGVDGGIWVLYCWKHAYPLVQYLPNFWQVNSGRIAPAVAAVWLGMFLSRRCRVEPGWIDRLGRAIGFGWLLGLLFGWPFLRGLFVVMSFLATSDP
jgi:hypothetical protein